jgi:hypothetical protein
MYIYICLPYRWHLRDLNQSLNNFHQRFCFFLRHLHAALGSSLHPQEPALMQIPIQ